MGRTVSNAPGCAPEDQFDPISDDFVSKERSYTHFDLPLTDQQRAAVRLSSDAIASHSFWPLLGFEAVERRAKRNAQGIIHFEEKIREIKFGSHKDAALLEGYCKLLSKEYEGFIADRPFNRSVLAYRSGLGDNISQARQLFDEIRRRGDCVAIALDIKGFFDNISHDVLRASLSSILGEQRLSAHHFAIFRRMTRFEWVDMTRVKARLGKRYCRFGRICTASEFRRHVRDLVMVNANSCGIPQGTPLSGLYANVSMAGFDERMIALTGPHGGSYRRYSDDIALVLPTTVDPDDFARKVSDELAAIGLELSPNKTDVVRFTELSVGQSATSPFQYLGFTFDGTKTLIRQSSLNRYYAKMSKGIRAKIRAAKENGVDKGEIYMRELFRRYTHFGQTRNFPRYAYRSAHILQAPEIRGQVRNHMERFKRLVRRHISEVY